MLKIGGYGFLRFSLPMVPDAAQELAWLVIFMSLVAIVYIGFIALVQTDMKKLVAYSSIAHMGCVTLGFFLIYPIVANNGGDTNGSALAIQGGMVQMVSHGFISGAMFLSIGVLYDRMHTREISAYGGVVNRMPIFGAFFILFAMANTGLPGTSGFVGEFMVILASFKANFWIAFLAATTLIVGAAYTLWLVKRVILGDIANENVGALNDLNRREFFMMAVLAIAVIVLGLWPDPLTHVMSDTIDHIIQQATTSKLLLP
jgi:NADH-quinone oxidoreductase subunit M